MAKIILNPKETIEVSKELLIKFALKILEDDWNNGCGCCMDISAKELLVKMKNEKT